MLDEESCNESQDATGCVVFVAVMVLLFAVAVFVKLRFFPEWHLPE